MQYWNQNCEKIKNGLITKGENMINLIYTVINIALIVVIVALIIYFIRKTKNR